MRIIGGTFKGIKIFEAFDKNTRPLKDLVKESILNILEHSKDYKINLNNSSVLDLFAGTGSFGLECVSRGSSKVYFVENYPQSIEILEKNIKKLKLKNKVKIYFDDVFDVIEKKNISESKFDLIFCDPPFKDTNIEKLIELVFNKKLLSKNGIIILHRNKTTREKLPNCIEIVEERTYGLSKIIFGKFLV